MTEYMVSFRNRITNKMVYVKMSGKNTDEVANRAYKRFKVSVAVRTKQNHGHYAWIIKYSYDDDFYRNTIWNDLPVSVRRQYADLAWTWGEQNE